MTTVVAGWSRIPAILNFPDTAGFAETYGFGAASGRVWLEGQYLVPRERASKTLYLFMHPSSTLHLLPMPAALADAGLHVLCAASRYPKNDSGLIMEKVAIDMGAWIKDARARGYETVILVGWSGGGSLSLFYQAEAEAPSIVATPAGDPVDLTRAGLEPADGVIFIAAHLSRAETLTEWLDPSVTDEFDPDRRNPEFDIYDAACPQQPPYPAAFVADFRAAQIGRNRNITAWCQERLDSLRRGGTSEVERCFVVHRTMCDVRWLELRDRPEREAAGLVLSRRSARCQHCARGASAILVIEVLAVAMELRFVECERAEKRRPHPPHPSLAGRESGRRRRARLAQSDNPRGIGDRGQGIRPDRGRDPLLPEPARPIAALHRCRLGLEPPQATARGLTRAQGAYRAILDGRPHLSSNTTSLSATRRTGPNRPIG